MKQNIALILFGLIVGSVLIGIAYPFIKSFNHSKSEAFSFNSVKDLKAKMLESDARDKKSNGSVSFRSIITPHYNDDIIYDLRPNLDVKFQQVSLKTNSCGLRGEDYTITKPDNTYRIALLGDSFAFGWGVEYEETFAKVMERALNKIARKGERVEVINFGVPGYSTFQEVALFEERGLELDFDAVLVYFVDNDFNLPFFVNGEEGKVENVLNFVRKVRKGTNKKLEEKNAQLISKIDPNKAITKLNALAREHLFKVFFAINPRPNWANTKKRLSALRRKKIKFIDIYTPFLELFNSSGYELKDLQLARDPHPNAIKHRMLGEVLASYFVKEIVA